MKQCKSYTQCMQSTVRPSNVGTAFKWMAWPMLLLFILFWWSDRGIVLVLSPAAVTKFQGEPFSGGVKYTGVGKLGIYCPLSCLLKFKKWFILHLFTLSWPMLLKSILYTYPTHLNKLAVLNNKLLRILQCAARDSHFVDLYTNFYTLTLNNLHKLKILLFVHKFFHHSDELPPIFSSYFV